MGRILDSGKMKVVSRSSTMEIGMGSGPIPVEK
jgi:hypothetical protein